MKTFLKFALAFALGSQVMACAKPKPVQPEVIVLKPQYAPSLFDEVEVPKPPVSSEQYKKMTLAQKEKVMFEINLELYKSLKEANLRLRTLREIVIDSTDDKKEDVKSEVKEKPSEKKPEEKSKTQEVKYIKF